MNKTTIGDLRKALSLYPDDWQVIFGCEELEFSRAKKRDEGLVQIEFSQTVYAKEGEVVVED
jgi:hypothetical protein